MGWIIALLVVVAAVVGLWVRQRLAVLKAKEALQGTIQAVITSFEDLTAKISASALQDSEKKVLVDNVKRNIDTLKHWQTTTLPNVTFWKNHVEPIQKEFNSLRELVTRDLASYQTSNAGNA